MTLSLSACFSEWSFTDADESGCRSDSWGRTRILRRDCSAAPAMSTQPSSPRLTLLTHSGTEPRSSRPHCVPLVLSASLVNSFIVTGSVGSTFDYLSLGFTVKSSSFVMHWQGRGAQALGVRRFTQERAGNAGSTIWINLAFKEFNCIIEIQGCAPETSIWYCQFQSWELWRHDDVFMEFAIEIMRNQSQRQDRWQKTGEPTRINTDRPYRARLAACSLGKAPQLPI